jgi:exodeoxyribonuclease VII small subunit
MTTENGPAEMTFEQALGRLESVVGAMEAGDLPLAEATGLYEDGMKLARVCNEMLAAAELKITRIQTAYGEQMRLPSEPGD